MTSLFSRLQKLNKEGTQLDWQVFDYGSRIEVASPAEHVCEIDASYDTPFPREQLEADAALIVECRNSLPAVLNLIEAVKESRWWATEWASTGSPYAREQMAAVNVKVDEALAVFVSGQED